MKQNTDTLLLLVMLELLLPNYEPDRQRVSSSSVAAAAILAQGSSEQQSLTFSVRVIFVISVMDSVSRLTWLSEQLMGGRQSRIQINAQLNSVTCHFMLMPNRNPSYVNNYALMMVMFLQESIPDSITMENLMISVAGRDRITFHVRRNPVTVEFPELVS